MKMIFILVTKGIRIMINITTNDKMIPSIIFLARKPKYLFELMMLSGIVVDNNSSLFSM